MEEVPPISGKLSALNVELIALNINDGSCAIHGGNNVLGEGFMAEERKETCSSGE